MCVCRVNITACVSYCVFRDNCEVSMYEEFVAVCVSAYAIINMHIGCVCEDEKFVFPRV